MAQLKGNGPEDGDIRLTVKKQGLGKMTGRTGYNVDCKITQRTEPGKSTQGKTVAEGGLKTEVDAHLRKIENDRSFEDNVIAKIKKLPMEGFGADKIALSLTQGQTVFIEHQICRNCHGQGRAICATCHGQGRAPCRKCSGSGDMNCFLCHGSGQVPNGNQQQICHSCQGRGRTYCDLCHGQKLVACASCNAKGTIACKPCQGKGAFSLIATVTPEATTQAEIHIHNLDPEPKRMASLISPEKLVGGGHAACRIVAPPVQEGEERAYYEDEPKAEKQAVYYEADLQWATTGLQLNGKDYEISFAGSKGAVCESGPFMDAVLQKPLAMLKDAATGKQPAATVITETCRYRFFRDMLAALIRLRHKKAAIILSRSYGLGLSRQTLTEALQSGNLALKKVTRRPRYIGLAAGLAIATALFGGWFAMGGRNMGAGLNENMRYALDTVLLVAAIGLTFAGVKLCGLYALKTVFAAIGVPATAKSVPAAGKAGLYGIGGCIGLWAVFFMLYAL